MTGMMVPRGGRSENESLGVEWVGQSSSFLGSRTVDIPKHIADQLQRVGGLRLHSVRPILEPDEHGDPRPVGSGVLLRFKGEHFLLSASHVMDRTDVSLYIGTETTWKELPHPYHYTVPSTEPDPFDVGFVHLPEELAHSLDGCVFLEESDIDLRERPSYKQDRRSLYLALGWPQNRFKFNWHEKKTKLENLGYFGPAAQQGLYAGSGLDPRLHLLIALDQEKVVHQSGSLGTPPKLHGISGGGVWRVDSFATRNPAADKLVAVTIRREPQLGCLVATRVGVLLEAITRRVALGPAA